MRTSGIVTLALTLFVALPAAATAAMYKCPGKDGKVEFTDRPCDAGTQITVQPNSVAAQDQSATQAKREAVDKKIRDARNAEYAENDRRARAQQDWVDRCQGARDEQARQAAWLRSQSQAVRASAAQEIAIQQRRFNELGCDRIMK